MFSAPKDVQRAFLNYTYSKTLLAFSLSSRGYRNLIHETYYQQRSRCRLLQYAKYRYSFPIEHGGISDITHLPNGNLENTSTYVSSDWGAIQYRQWKDGRHHGYDVVFHLPEYRLWSCSYYNNGLLHGNVYEEIDNTLSLASVWDYGKIIKEYHQTFIGEENTVRNVSYYKDRCIQID